MNSKLQWCFLVLVAMTSTFKTGVTPMRYYMVNQYQLILAINCYQCSGTDPNNPFICNEFLGNNEDELELKDCKGVYGASHCVKHTGRFEGGIGTIRYCSSLDLGNYCNYVKNKGDELEYRSCIFTCSTDGCNSSTTFSPTKITLVAATMIVYLMVKFVK